MRINTDGRTTIGTCLPPPRSTVSRIDMFLVDMTARLVYTDGDDCARLPVVQMQLIDQCAGVGAVLGHDECPAQNLRRDFRQRDAEHRELCSWVAFRLSQHSGSNTDVDLPGVVCEV